MPAARPEPEACGGGSRAGSRLRSRAHGRLPGKAGEAGEVTVEGRQRSALLESDGSQESVGRQVARRLAFVAEPLEDLEVPAPWYDRHMVGLSPDGVQEGEGIA